MVAWSRRGGAQEIFSGVEVVMEERGLAKGHEKSLPHSEINKCKLLEKMVCPRTALLGRKSTDGGGVGKRGGRLGTDIYLRGLSTPQF